ncbi:MAG: 3',5'-cyclic adenosine monophosphate phosphodiesterase CpdA [Deltaproteobacteria bacterium]|jgi:3',5'-cyclic AMP phosphodiesterase CpdA|nr:3',5'-cyclic adenosine monophosphate phosphodiesterase CpdA [Deltaproteobacteria bacterium]
MAKIHPDQQEMHKVLGGQKQKPDNTMSISRRTFLHKSIISGGVVGAATYGWWPLVNTIDIAHGASNLNFAWVSDTHLYPKTLNTRFVDKAVRAFKEVESMKPDFMIFGGDLAQKGDPEELKLGAQLLKAVTVKKVFIPGEHDWYLDMGALWTKEFGSSPWSFDLKGVHFVGLDTVSRAPDYWSAKNMSPKERMGHMEALDGSVAGPWAGLGQEQLKWLDTDLSGLNKSQPIVIFSHNPLYEYYPPWNFWVRDWREVHEIVRPYSNVTNIHGHTHQVLYNEIGSMRSIGMLATSWPWPYAPEGVPKLTKPHVRVDPGDPFDGVGWAKHRWSQQDRIDHDYMMWDRDVYADATWDSGTGDNPGLALRSRVVDKIWQYE